MRPVYMLSGGITKFAKAHPDRSFRVMVKEALDAALGDLGGRLTVGDIDGSVISYFSDHFTGQRLDNHPRHLLVVLHGHRSFPHGPACFGHAVREESPVQSRPD